MRIVALVVVTLLLAGVFGQPARADISFEMAYSHLSSHGTWLVSEQYGRVWQPREYNRQWDPYYDGQWVYTDMGWAWVSAYEWGAIPYHYGTWVADRHAGWVWIPGRVWAPSWVIFRTGPDCIGWARVLPGYSVGMRMYLPGPSNYVFVSSRDFLAPRLRTSILSRDRVNIFINKTKVVNNIVVRNNVVVNRGPDSRFVERATGRRLNAQRIEHVTRVAPFQHVSRAQLAVDPVRARQGPRVAEQVPASRPLPRSDGRYAKRPSTQQPASRPASARPPTHAGEEAKRTSPPPGKAKKDDPGKKGQSKHGAQQ